MGAGIISSSESTPPTVFGGRVTGWPARGVFIGGPGRVHDLHVADSRESGIGINGGSFSFPDGSRVSAIERYEVRNVRRWGIVASVARPRPRGGEGAPNRRILGLRHSRRPRAGQPGDQHRGGVWQLRATGISADVVAHSTVEDVVGSGAVAHIEARQVMDSRAARAVAPITSIGLDQRIKAQLMEHFSNTGAGEAFGIKASTVAFLGTGTSQGLALRAKGNTVSGVAGVGTSGNNGTVHISGNQPAVHLHR